MNRTEEFILSACRTGPFTQNTNTISPVRYLDVKINASLECIEVPDFCLVGIPRWFESTTPCTLTYCLSPNPVVTQRRLVRGALFDFTMAMPRRRISTVKMSNDVIYHGAPGVIFNENFDILMMITSTIIPQESSQASFKIVRRNCRISPLVFQSTNIIEKTIVKKMLPFCASHAVDALYEYGRFSASYVNLVHDTTIRVIIDDVNKDFIRDVVPPKLSEFTPENIHSLLQEHVEDIAL